MYWSFTCMYVCVRDLDPLELELQRIVRHRVGAENWAWGLWESSQCLRLLNHLHDTSFLSVLKHASHDHMLVSNLEAKATREVTNSTTIPIYCGVSVNANIMWSQWLLSVLHKNLSCFLPFGVLLEKCLGRKTIFFILYEIKYNRWFLLFFP